MKHTSAVDREDPRADALHPQLEALTHEIEEATARAKRLADGLDDAAFEKRPAEGSWSPAECLVHLNLTTKGFLPKIDDALAGAPEVRLDPARSYRKDLVGWLLGRVLEPPVRRMKVKTAAPFVPQTWSTRDEVVHEFEGLQQELTHRLVAANARDIGGVKVTSPFSSRTRYNLLAAFSVIVAHERRHLWQAERAVAAGSRGGQTTA